MRGIAAPTCITLFNNALLVALGCGQGARPCAIGGVLKESALMWAARQGFMAVISDLLDVSDVSIRGTR